MWVRPLWFHNSFKNWEQKILPDRCKSAKFDCRYFTAVYDSIICRVYFIGGDTVDTNIKGVFLVALLQVRSASFRMTLVSSERRCGR